MFLPFCVYVVHTIAHSDFSYQSALFFSLPVLDDYFSEPFHGVDSYLGVDVSLDDEDNRVVQDSCG